MRIEEGPGLVTVDAPAKLNLYLDVLSRRDDGYHELDTVMQEIDLYDRLELRPAPSGVSLVCSRPDLPAGEENLVYRAVRDVLGEAGENRGVEVTLLKRIPIGGGLGGGSSDAAAALVGTDRLLGLGLSREVLGRLAEGLGADVPFFLEAGAARCRGVGDRIEPIPQPASYEFLIVWPGVPCSTREVFRRFKLSLTAKNRGASFVAEALEADDPRQLGAGLFNRLEAVVRGIHPEFSRIRPALEKLPLLGVGMTGSGSCFFGLIDPSEGPAEEIEDLERQAREATGLVVYRVRGLR